VVREGRGLESLAMFAMCLHIPYIGINDAMQVVSFIQITHGILLINVYRKGLCSLKKRSQAIVYHARNQPFSIQRRKI